MADIKNEIQIIFLNGEIEIIGEFIWGSNHTFLVQVSLDSSSFLAVYKPTRGEIPLWDFPAYSLAHREIAAYLVSEAIGWNFVPTTVYRADAPLGPGSLQQYVEHDPNVHYFNLSQQNIQRLRPVVLFDMIINNADRKGSHIIIDEVNKIWLIDHGVSFHEDVKLRTVVWDFVGEKIPEALKDDVIIFVNHLETGKRTKNHFFQALSSHISAVEIDRLFQRTKNLLKEEKFLFPDEERRFYPWPQL